MSHACPAMALFRLLFYLAWNRCWVLADPDLGTCKGSETETKNCTAADESQANLKHQLLAEEVDLQRYPINDLGSVQGQLMLKEIRADLEKEGCVVLKGFMTSSWVTKAVAETWPLIDKRFVPDMSRNIYHSSKEDPSLPKDHPANTFFQTKQAFIAGDWYSNETAVKRLYYYPPLLPFLSEVMGKTVYVSDDPFNSASMSVQTDNVSNSWHFDSNEFGVSVMVQKPEKGGDFQFAPGIRSATDEKYEAVQQLLEDKYPDVRTSPLQPGDVQIFKGRYLAHRVTAAQGSTPRFLLSFGYAPRRGFYLHPDRARTIYGRSLQCQIDSWNRESSMGVDGVRG